MLSSIFIEARIGYGLKQPILRHLSYLRVILGSGVLTVFLAFSEETERNHPKSVNITNMLVRIAWVLGLVL